MKHILIIGSGLSGLSCAIELAENGISSTLVSPYPSERAQSVMAAGGINAAIGVDDSVNQHAEDTLKSGGSIAGKEAVAGLCSVLLAAKATTALPTQVLPPESKL